MVTIRHCCVQRKCTCGIVEFFVVLLFRTVSVLLVFLSFSPPSLFFPSLFFWSTAAAEKHSETRAACEEPSSKVVSMTTAVLQHTVQVLASQLFVCPELGRPPTVVSTFFNYRYIKDVNMKSSTMLSTSMFLRFNTRVEYCASHCRILLDGRATASTEGL